MPDVINIIQEPVSSTSPEIKIVQPFVVNALGYLTKEYADTLYEPILTGAELDAVTSGITSEKVTAYDAHLIDTDNPHSVTKSQIGLGNVENYGQSAVPVQGSNLYFTAGGAYTEFAKKQDVIDISHKLSSDLVDDTGHTNKFVSATEKAQITTNKNDITTINSYIPSGTTSSNKLVDKSSADNSYVERDKQETYPLSVYVQFYNNGSYYDSVRELVVSANANSIPLRNTRGEILVPTTTYGDAAVNYTQLQNYVSSRIASALVAVYKPQGSATIIELNTLTKSESMNGYVYNVIGAGYLNNYNGTIAVKFGENVAFIWNNGSWYWDPLGGFVDLSNYYNKTESDNKFVQKTTTIAGLDLSQNRSASELLNALFDVSVVEGV